MSGFTFAALGEEFLSHFGVKGMRWGVRRSQAELDRAANRTEEKKESDSGSGSTRTASSYRNTTASSLTDKELKAAVNRMQMEQNFARLQPTPLSTRAAQFAGRLVSRAAEQELSNYVNRTIHNQLGDLLTNASRPSIPPPPNSFPSAPPNPLDRRG